MSPSAIDLEIRSLSLGEEGGELMLFLDMLCEGMKEGRDFELLQAYLAAFLRIHETALAEIECLREKIKVLGDVQGKMWAKLKVCSVRARVGENTVVYASSCACVFVWLCVRVCLIWAGSTA